MLVMLFIVIVDLVLLAGADRCERYITRCSG
jgi:hypothetical protein